MRKEKRHELNCFINDLYLLSKEPSLLRAITNFAARYRFLTASESPENRLHLEAIYTRLYSLYINRWIEKNIKNSKSAEQLSLFVKKIAEEIIKSADQNYAWALLLTNTVYRQPLLSYLHYRPLVLERVVRGYAFIAKSSVSNHTDIFVRDFLPAFSFSMVSHLTLVMVATFLAVEKVISLCDIGSDNLKYLIAFVVIFCLFNALLLNIQTKRPSFLEYERLPVALKTGLLAEISDIFRREIQQYSRKQRTRNNVCSEEKKNSVSVIKKESVSFIAASPRSLEASLTSVPKKPGKIKRRSSQPSLPYTLPLFLVVYSWHTEELGRIEFQPGRAYEDLIPLWSKCKKYDNQYVVLFRKKDMQGDSDLIAAFWRIAHLGCIVHKEGQAGYVFVAATEKNSHKSELPGNTILKVKPRSGSFYNGYRQAVCFFAAADQPNGPMLLRALPPVRAYNH